MADEIKKEEQKADDNNAAGQPQDESSFVKTTEGLRPSSLGAESETLQAVAETELEKCSREKAEYLAGWQRAKADFLNYQKDEKKRLEEFLKWAQAGLIEDLLPVLDSFDIALSSAKGDIALSLSKGGQEISDNRFQGFLLIKSQMDEVLKKRGLEPIKSLGEKFNPELHEAVDSTSSPQVAEESKTFEPDTIVEEIQKGYTLNGKVLRPSKVKIVK